MARSSDKSLVATFETLGLPACLYDRDHAALAWNATYLTLFPEHEDGVLGLASADASRATANLTIGTAIERRAARRFRVVTRALSRSRLLRVWQELDGAEAPRMPSDPAEPDARQRLARAEAKARESERALLRVHAKLAAMSRSDAVTALANRRGFDPRAEDAWRGAVRENSCIAVLAIDIDRFARTVDRHGHAAGDECLRRFADILRDAAAWPPGLLAHSGGGAFIGWLRCESADEAAARAEGIRKAVAAARWSDLAPSMDPLTASIGLATAWPAAAETTLADTLREAEELVRRAKRSGGNRLETPTSPARDEGATVIPFMPRRAAGRD